MVPAGPSALEAARANLEWAVKGILAGDFPMRPHPAKCRSCGYRKACRAAPEPFRLKKRPPDLVLAGGPAPAGAFGLYEGGEGE
jgi:DNA helicase-2/ATP-dependent DNA helicase PcrA